MPFKKLVIAGTLAVVTSVSFAQVIAQQKEKAAEPESATVDFGVLPTAPIGPAPCLQTGAIGGPADPCSYKLHHLTPEEVTIDKGGEVTFQVHGGGHGLAIYEVGKNITRDDIGQLLCAGMDPETIADPANHACNLSAANSDAPHMIEIGRGDVLAVPAGTHDAPQQPGVGGRRPAHVGGRHAVPQRRDGAGRANVERSADHLPIPQDWPLPRPLPEPRALSQRLDVRLRQRELRHGGARPRRFAPADSRGRGACPSVG